MLAAITIEIPLVLDWSATAQALLAYGAAILVAIAAVLIAFGFAWCSLRWILTGKTDTGRDFTLEELLEGTPLPDKDERE